MKKNFNSSKILNSHEGLYIFSAKTGLMSHPSKTKREKNEERENYIYIYMYTYIFINIYTHIFVCMRKRKDLLIFGRINTQEIKLKHGKKNKLN